MSGRYYIPYNAGCESPASLLFVDCETDFQALLTPAGAREERLRLWVACIVRLKSGKVCRESWHSGTTAEAFWNLVFKTIRPKQPLTLFAHNATFDMTVLGFWERVEDGLLSLFDTKAKEGKGGPQLTGKLRPLHGCMILASPPTIIVAKTSRGKLTILDTMNWWKCPLAELGEGLGIPKLSMPDRQSDSKSWFEYCKNDVLIIKEAVCKLIGWLKDEDLGNWRYTSASQAFGTWRHRFCPKRVQIHRDPLALPLERRAFYGGETRCFFWGHCRPMGDGICNKYGLLTYDGLPACYSPIYHVDICSLYPSVMRNRWYPCRLLGTHQSYTAEKLQSCFRSLGVIADVILRTHDVYPIRDNEGKVTYQTGYLKTTLCGPELEYALSQGDIISIGTTAIYELGELFAGFVDYFYSLKEANERGLNKAYALFYKMCLNSLWGKFAQKQGEWVDAPGVAAPDPWGYFGQWDGVTGELTRYRAIGWHVQRQTMEEEARYSFPAIAAYVTSYARLRMRIARQLACEKNVLYQDTDSLHVNQAGVERLGNPPGKEHVGLGDFYTVEVAQTARYYGIRDYVLDGRRVAAGVRRSATWEDERTVTQEDWEKMDHILERGNASTVQVYQQKLRLQASHTGGNVQRDGRVLPFRSVET